MSRAALLALDEPVLFAQGVTAGATKKLLASLRADANTLPWSDDDDDAASPPAAATTPVKPMPRLSSSFVASQAILEDDDAGDSQRGRCARCGAWGHVVAACPAQPRPAPYAPRLDFKELPAPK